MSKNFVIGILIVVIGVLAIGNIDWYESSKIQDAEIERLNKKYEILEESYKQGEEVLLKACEENDKLKEELINATESKREILTYEYIGEYTITAYCCEKYPHICGGGNTATGVPPTPNLTCAVCDLSLMPYGTIIYIEDVGIRIVQDTGGFHSNKIDVALKTHEEAVKWKTGKHKVWIIKEANND